MEELKHCSANYVPLSPISFLERAGIVYKDRTSLVYGSRQFTWAETLDRCLKLASALHSFNISTGDVHSSNKQMRNQVAAVAPNIPAMYELHFGVPMVGAVLCTLNIRQDAHAMSVLLRHSEAKLVFVDYQFLEVVRAAFNILSKTTSKLPSLVVIPELDAGATIKIGHFDLEYERILKNRDPNFQIRWPKDEWQPIALNYTSGTTSNPKGVVYSHRGAYLNALASILMCGMKTMPVYLWTVPMFHCNGWCFTWGVAAQGGTNVCLRAVNAKNIYDAIVMHKVTNLAGAPTVLNIIANAQPHEKKPLPNLVEIVTGGAPPPSQILFTMAKLGFNVTHSFGLTETYGPASVCVWKPEWDSLSIEEQSRLKARQGVHHLGLSGIDVKNPKTMESVPHDGRTIGEVMIRGNTVMNGYLKDAEASRAVFEGGWFHTGDLGVMHPDGYVELKDRSKDIIISGGENISTIEIESVLYTHPEILEAAVVGRPDDYWGETPCAFVKLKEPNKVTSESIISFCRARLPHYMAPRTVIFEDLPKTSTGKIQKFVLRQKAKALGSIFSRHHSKL